jgi:hypothetical protein
MTLLNNMLRKSLLSSLGSEVIRGEIDLHVDTHLNTSIMYFLVI